MRKLLITGANSYVGNAFKQWAKTRYPNLIQVETRGMRNGEWKNHSFVGYDVILHVAGIAHVSTDKSMEELYYRVNTNLTTEVAVKAKDSGVNHFIFLSSMIVYGDATNARLITTGTVPKPTSFYGNSKLQAEKKLAQLEDATFRIANVRRPMIYGHRSKGNYVKLAGLAKKCRFFQAIRINVV